MRQTTGFRLLVADIDGTLLTSDRRVTPGVARAIRAARERGVRVCLATGRMWRSAAPHVAAAGADPPAILYNGGLVYDFQEDRVLYRRTLGREAARAALQVLRNFPDVQPHLFVDDRALISKMNRLSEEYARKDGIRVEEVGDLLDFLCDAGSGVCEPDRGRPTEPFGEPMKILIVGDRPRLEQVAGAFSAASHPLNFVFSEANYLEVLPPGASKGEALRWLAEWLAVPPESIVAVGDNLNDLSMIRFAGLGVAMANAPDALRSQARYVAPRNDEEGLRDVIERFILTDPDGRPGGPDEPGAGPAESGPKP